MKVYMKLHIPFHVSYRMYILLCTLGNAIDNVDASQLQATKLALHSMSLLYAWV